MTIVTKDGKVVMRSEVPYPAEIKKSMKQNGYKVREV